MTRPLITAVFAIPAALALGQGGAPPTLKLVFPKTAKAGTVVKGTIEVTFADGLHGYQNPPTEDYQIPVKLSIDTKGFVLGKPAYPKGVLRTMGGDTKPSAVYEGTIRIPVTVTLPKKPGSAAVKFTLNYQECNEQSCYPPATVSDTVKLTITK
jgi:DsbC/DsbD-like thiol-disulfide interchange protein